MLLWVNSRFFDIAYRKDEFWFAVDSYYPIQAYNEHGICIVSIPPSIIPDAHGMTFDPEEYLWVSDMTAQKIYKVDLNATSLSHSQSSLGSIKSVNFAEIQVLDLKGRIIKRITSDYAKNLTKLPKNRDIYILRYIDRNCNLINIKKHIIIK